MMMRSRLLILKSEIDTRIQELECMVSKIEQVLKELHNETPSYVEKAALGAFLHSFYNGVENILKRIVEEIDQTVPVGSDWHRVLLRRATTQIEGVRPAVLSSETLENLIPYLGFRHFFRHSYTFEIDWKKLEPLVQQVRSVFERFVADLQHFFQQQAI